MNILANPVYRSIMSLVQDIDFFFFLSSRITWWSLSLKCSLWCQDGKNIHGRGRNWLLWNQFQSMCLGLRTSTESCFQRDGATRLREERAHTLTSRQSIKERERPARSVTSCRRDGLAPGMHSECKAQHISQQSLLACGKWPATPEIPSGSWRESIAASLGPAAGRPHLSKLIFVSLHLSVAQ